MCGHNKVDEIDKSKCECKCHR